MKPEEIKRLQEMYAGVPMNALMSELWSQMDQIDETIKDIGLGGKLADTLVTSKLLLDEMYSRFFGQHRLSLKLEEYIG